MAKTPKFSEDMLLEAVVKYAEQHRGKIEATKLAKWASKNVEGLEGVEDRHFMRPAKKKDPKTGQVISYVKLCTQRINELNSARNTVTAMNSNPLLKSASIDKFFSLPIHEQRKAILDTRAQVDKLIEENANLRSENKAVSSVSQTIAAKVDDLSQKLEGLRKEHDKLLVLVSRAMDKVDEEERKRMLKTIGVCDELFDLDAYANSLTLGINEVFSINDVIRKQRLKTKSADINDLMEGFEFE